MLWFAYADTDEQLRVRLRGQRDGCWSNTAPNEDSSCWPNASTTGPSGSLTPSGPITTSSNGQTIENVEVGGDITVNHDNVTIRNVKVSGGRIETGFARSGILIEDVEVDGGNATQSCIGQSGFTARRVELHRCGQGVNTYGYFTLEDSYIHSLYTDGVSHSETVLIAGSDCTDSTTVRRNNLIASWSVGSQTNQMSAVAVIYTHPDTWDPQQCVTFSYNRLEDPNSGANYMFYFGSDSSAFNRLTQSTAKYNRFVRSGGSSAGFIAQQALGTGNTQCGNKDDGDNDVTISGVTTSCP